MPVTKVAISIPKDLYRAVEKTRKKNRKTRSAAVQEALRQWLKRQHEAELDRQYEEGYRRMPENRGDAEASLAVALPSIAAEEW